MFLNFLQNNWISILVVLALLLYIALLICKKKWVHLRELAYKIMLAAEKTFGQGEGKKKFEIVFERVYALIPAWLRLFIPPERLREKLQEWYILAKDYLDDGTVNNSV